MSNVVERMVEKYGKPIKIQVRSLADGFDDVETQTFTTVAGGAVDAVVCTPRGTAVFDGVDTEVDVTHKFCMVWPGFDVTVENWIYLPEKNKRYRVLDGKNCAERDIATIVQCTERGIADRGATGA